MLEGYDGKRIRYMEFRIDRRGVMRFTGETAAAGCLLFDTKGVRLFYDREARTLGLCRPQGQEYTHKLTRIKNLDGKIRTLELWVRPILSLYGIRRDSRIVGTFTSRKHEGRLILLADLSNAPIDPQSWRKDRRAHWRRKPCEHGGSESDAV